MKNIFIAASLFILLFSYQNCVEFEAQKESPEQIYHSGYGTGEGIEGKLIGQYYRMVPEHQCEQTASAFGELSINNLKQAGIKLNPSQKCASQFLPIGFKAIDWSPLNLNVIGYLGGLYERKPQKPEAEGYSLFTEAWCKLDTESHKLDLVVKYNIAQQQTSAQWTQIDSHNSIYNDSLNEMTRIVTDDSVFYSSDKFTLKIQRNTFAGIQYGTFAGEFKTQLNSKSIQTKVNCYLGGPLDPIHHEIQLNPSAYGQVMLSPSGKNILYSQFSSQGQRLWSFNIKNKSIKSLSPAYDYIHLSKELMLRSSEQVFYVTRKEKDINLMRTHLEKNQSQQINTDTQNIAVLDWSLPAHLTSDNRILYTARSKEDNSNESGHFLADLSNIIFDSTPLAQEKINGKLLKYDKNLNAIFYAQHISEGYDFYIKYLNNLGQERKIGHISKRDENDQLRIFAIWPKNFHILPNKSGVYLQNHKDLFYMNLNDSQKNKIYKHTLLVKMNPNYSQIIVRPSYEPWELPDRLTYDYSLIGENQQTYRLSTTLPHYSSSSISSLDTLRFRFSNNGSTLYFESKKKELLALDTLDLQVMSLTQYQQHSGIVKFELNTHNNQIYFWLKDNFSDSIGLFTWNPKTLRTEKIQNSTLTFNDKLKTNILNTKFKISKNGEKAIFYRDQNLHIIYLNGLGKIHVHKNLNITHFDADDNLENILIRQKDVNGFLRSSWIQF